MVMRSRAYRRRRAVEPSVGFTLMADPIEESQCSVALDPPIDQLCLPSGGMGLRERVRIREGEREGRKRGRKETEGEKGVRKREKEREREKERKEEGRDRERANMWLPNEC